MVAKYPGECRDCGARIARGCTITYHGRGAGVSCSACAQAGAGGDGAESDPDGEDHSARMRCDRAAAPRVSVTRFAGGGVSYRNSRGRCEDAPCCGCCS